MDGQTDKVSYRSLSDHKKERCKPEIYMSFVAQPRDQQTNYLKYLELEESSQT